MFPASARNYFVRPFAAARSFSSTASRSYDLAKLVLVGRLGKAPEKRLTKSGGEYYHYTVATTNFPPPPPNPDGTRSKATTTWHSILSFSPVANNYIQTLRKGSRVYVEAGYEVRDPDLATDPSTSHGQRQIFLRHETLRVLERPPLSGNEQETEPSTQGDDDA